MTDPDRRAPRVTRALAAFALTVTIALSLSSCSSVPRRLAQPQANLLSLSIIEASPEGQLFALQIQLVNPNETEIPIVRLDFDIRLGGEGRLIGEHVTAFTLPARGSEIVDVEVFSGLVSSASRLMAFTQGPENALSYEFYGELYLEARLREPLSVFRRGQVPLTITSRTN